MLFVRAHSQNLYVTRDRDVGGRRGRRHCAGLGCPPWEVRLVGHVESSLMGQEGVCLQAPCRPAPSGADGAGGEARVQLGDRALGAPLGVARSSEQGCGSQCPRAVSLGTSVQGPGQSLRTARSSEQGCGRQCPQAVGLGRRRTFWWRTVGRPNSGASRRARRPFLCGRSERT